MNFARGTVINQTEGAFVDLTVVIVGFDRDGKPTGFGSTSVEYLVPGMQQPVSVTWSGPTRTTAAVKIYANFPWNNPPPLPPQGAP